MKNFKLIKGSNAVQGMVLIHLETRTVYHPFSRYIEILYNKDLSYNTIDSYALHTAQFLDFMFELTRQKDNDSTDPKNIFTLYHDLLLNTQSSENQMIRNLSIELKRTSTSRSTITGQIEAALIYFLELLKLEGDHPFFQAFEFESTLTEAQMHKIKQSSWLAQCIRWTEQSLRTKVKLKIFPKSNSKSNVTFGNISNTYEKAMPSNNILEYLLLQKSELALNPSLSKSRSYLLDSMLATSGVRVSEAMQVTLEDIDTVNRKLKIVNINNRTYKGLTFKEQNLLVYKGRATEKTLLIEPFSTIFWDALGIYLSKYHKSNMGHNFLFQKNNGRPYFTIDRSQRYKDLKTRISKHLGSKFAEKYAFHSFRHAYGVYTHNHLPIVDDKGEKTGRFGLDTAYVQILMGHSSIRSTQSYARKDSSVAELLITLANNKIKFGNYTLKDVLTDFKAKELERLTQELDNVTSQMAIEIND